MHPSVEGELEIAGNTFNNLLISGVNMERSGKIINVKNNHFTFVRTGVRLADNFGAEMNVFDNDFNLSTTWFYGSDDERAVFVNNSVMSESSSRFAIYHNTIKNCRRGIEMLNEYAGSIYENTIAFDVDNNFVNFPANNPSNFHWTGIISDQCYNLKIRDNIITRPDISQTGFEIPNSTSADYLKGIELSYSNRADVFRNTIYNMGASAQILENCFESNLRCNYFNSCYIGVNFVNGGLLDQGDAANPTNNEWINFGVRNRLDGIALNRVNWFYDPSSPDYDPNPYGGNVIASQLAGNSLGLCSVDEAPGNMREGFLKMIQDTLFNSNKDQNIYRNAESVFRLLRHNDTTLVFGSDSIGMTLQNFYSLTSLGNVGLLDDVQNHLRNRDSANALIVNGGIDPQNLMESNSRFVNELCIEFANRPFDLDEIQHAQLLSIAYQSPIAGGEAVYRARAILWLEVDDSQLSYRLLNEAFQQDFSHLAIYPNPCEGFVYLELPVDADHPAQAEIMDITGRVIGRQSLRVGYVHKISVSNAAGIYFLRIEQNKMESFKKIVVSSR